MTTGPLAFLHATLDAVQAEAEAARPGPWAVWSAHHNVAVVHDSGQRSGSGLPLGPLVVSASSDHALPDAVHIARHNPAAVLRRIKADRKLIAMHVGDHECWVYDPTGETDRSTFVLTGETCSTVQLLAEGWGWTEKT